ncbi:MAG: serine acetyltransferase [Bacteroidetes bacterium 4572_117]|nr:MAG: serine acetyltransferase [Bacteroidetes bacterium 4572_117]
MQKEEITQTLAQTVVALSDFSSSGMVYAPKHGRSMPSIDALNEIMSNLRSIIFPGYYGKSRINTENLSYYIGVSIDRTFYLLSEQIARGICFAQIENETTNCELNDKMARDITVSFFKLLPEIRESLILDVKSTYNGDPAANSYGAIIYSYPGLKATMNYRIASTLLQLKVPLIPRIITEMAHSETGIDINPGAQIGNSFTMDHGTGIVIGETCIIGNFVKLYQGVTLGAKSFPLDKDGNPIKGVARHPIVEDNVVIYAQATILGTITVGEGSVIGGNVWVTNNVAKNSKILQPAARDVSFNNGLGT